MESRSGIGTQGIQNEGDGKDAVFAAEVDWLLARKPLKVVALSFFASVLLACSHCPCQSSVRSQAVTASAG